MENANKEKPRFPYTVEQKYIEYQDKQCCYKMSNRTGFHFFRCSKPATKKIDNAGFCGRHARSVEIWRKKTCEQN